MTIGIIYNKSCLKFDEIGNEMVNLIVTSPPYGTSVKYSEHKEQIGNFHKDMQLEFLKKIWLESYRVLKDGGFLIVNINDYADDNDGIGSLYPYTAKLILDVMSCGFIYNRQIIWNKDGQSMRRIGRKTPYFYGFDYEPFLVFRKVEMINYRDDIDYMNDFDKIDEKLKNRWKNYNFKSIWLVRPNTSSIQMGKKLDLNGVEDLHHPASFPDEIIRRILAVYSNENDWVMDMFSGSGTVMKISKEMNRNYVGYEINEEYIPIIKGKVDVKQKSLLDDYKSFFFIDGLFIKTLKEIKDVLGEK